MIKKKKIAFFTIGMTFFVDYLCWAIVFPIFPPYFLDEHNQLFSASVPLGTRTMLLGFFLMAFSLGQFLAAPLNGEYADKHGRKKALAVNVLLAIFGLCLTAYSMRINNLYGLFFGRFITGIFSSSAAICLSCVTDLSTNEEEKVKYFVTLSMIAGLSFVLGAFLGGQLSDSTVSSYFSASLPLWLAAGLTLINFLFVLFGFKETSTIHPDVKFHFLESFQNIKIALQTGYIKRIYAIYFLFFMAWTILFQFIPVITIERFNFTNSNIGYLALFMGICWAIGSGYLNKFLVRHFDSMRVLEACLIGFTVLAALVVFPKHIYTVLAIIGFCIFCGSIAWPICTGLISSKAPKHMQGKILGLSQSVQSLAMSVAPVIGGIAFKHSLTLPFLLSGIICAVAFITYYFALKLRS